MQEFPNVATETLKDLLLAVRRRSKALRHKFRKLTLVASSDGKDDPPLEKLDITFQKGATTNSARIKLVIWADRWVWIDAREPSKQGWRWSCTFDGRLAGGKSGADLLQAVEDFATLLPSAGVGGNLAAADNIWSRILLKGPQGSVRR